jgi:hypothetical protein
VLFEPVSPAPPACRQLPAQYSRVQYSTVLPPQGRPPGWCVLEHNGLLFKLPVQCCCLFPLPLLQHHHSAPAALHALLTVHKPQSLCTQVRSAHCHWQVHDSVLYCRPAGKHSSAVSEGSGRLPRWCNPLRLVLQLLLWQDDRHLSCAAAAASADGVDVAAAASKLPCC